MLKILWEQGCSYLIVYCVSWLFFGIMGTGSLNHFALVAKATEEDLDYFLNTLRFPFRQVVDIFYGRPQEHEIELLMTTSRLSAWFTRLLGAVPPAMFIAASAYNLATYQHSLAECAVILLRDIALYLVTFWVMWRFGHKLQRNVHSNYTSSVL